MPERSPGGDRQAALAVLAGRFGDRTAALVAAVTNSGWEPGRDEHEDGDSGISQVPGARPGSS
jgi:hypothetical protein